MKRISVDIGGTFTDCFVVWDDQYLQAKALTTHHNLALGFNDALRQAHEELGISREEMLSQVDSVRYATTLGTNALIERKGPKVGLITTSGFESTVPVSRGRGYGEGLPKQEVGDLTRATRPEPLVPIPLIRGVRERLDYLGDSVIELDEQDVREKLRELVDSGIQALVVNTAHSVENPENELRIREIFFEDYPRHMLGGIPIVLGHEVAGRRGEYVRATSAIIDAFLHSVMYHAMSSLELNLRDSGYKKPMLVVHNSSGMAQLNSTDALQTVHSGPVSGIQAADHLAQAADLGSVVCTDMGGTSFDIGIVVEGGIKHYDFNPVIDRWLVSVPMVHLVTLGAGGGSIARYNRLDDAVSIGPESAGSEPGPACYDRGGLNPTVTDADLLLGYLDPENYAAGAIQLNPKRANFAMEDLCDELDLDEVDVAKVIKKQADNDMAMGMLTELRAHGYDPAEFTMLAYGGNGPLHCCGIAEAAGINKVLAPPFSSVFSACGAGSMDQLHIHEKSVYVDIYNTMFKTFYDDFDGFNSIIEELEQRGLDDLMRQGIDEERVKFRLELDLSYGNQKVVTAVVSPHSRLKGIDDLLDVIEHFSESYGERFGEGSQAPEAGIRISTVRVASYVEANAVEFAAVKDLGEKKVPPAPIKTVDCHFVALEGVQKTPIYGRDALEKGVTINGPAIVNTGETTYLVEPGWQYRAAAQGAVWFFKQ